MPIQTRPYRITQLKLEECIGHHREDILTLWKNNLLITCAARLEWFYLQNPWGPAVTWFAVAVSEARAVGLASLYPRGLWVEGKAHKIASAIDISVDRSHRAFGPAVTMAKAATAGYRNHGFEFILASPNRPAKGVFKLSGYQPLGEQRNWAKVVQARYFLARSVKWSAAAAFLGRIADAWLWLADYPARSRYRRPDLDAEEVKRCDRRFDELWEEAKRRDLIVNIKDAAYLNWRYADCRTMDHTFYCLTERATGRLRGFLVYTVLNHIAIITDLLTADLETAGTLLLNFHRHMRRHDASHLSLSYLGNEPFVRLIQELHFACRNVVRHSMLYIDERCSETLKTRLFDPGRWSLFEGDLDL